MEPSELTGLTYSLAGNVLGNLTYAYDADGRRTQMSGSWARTGMPNPTTSSAVYNAANELTNWNGATLTYDGNGNIKNDSSNTYGWNARNQLDSISGTTAASFQYDPFGRRLGKTINAATTNFLYDGVNPVEELVGGSPSANLLTGLSVDEYFQRTDLLGTSDFLSDALGSTVVLADSTGTVQTEYTYTPFGGTTAQGTGSGNSFQYTARENDGDGLYFHRARYYSPRLQRFISEDPMGIASGVNSYSYVGDSPERSTDRSGECSDPGGPGIRYCIDRYIPTRKTPFPFPFDGDNRGPNPNGGTYRTQQLIFQNNGHATEICEMGTSTIGGRFGIHGWLGRHGMHGRKDGSIQASCAGGVGYGFGMAPEIQTNVTIAPDGSVSVTGTTYPSVEVWQYQDGRPPRLLFNYNATGQNPFDLLNGARPLQPSTNGASGSW